MKYLFIFLPFFAMAQDSTLYGKIKPVGTTIDTCWQIKNGYMSLKPGCVFNSPGFLVDSVKHGGVTAFQELYLEDRSFELIDSFRFNGAYYELRDNGWYKEILPDTIPRDTLIPVKPRMMGYAPNGGGNGRWKYCDQHFGETDHPKRDKIEQSEVKLLVWTGCALVEWKATKFIGYNYGDNSFWIDDTVKVKDFIIWYLAGDRWIKTSHVIKEL